MTSASSVDLAGRRVLVVEDQFLIALDLQVMLRTLGAAAVDLVTSLPEALAAIDRMPPDLALLDLKLGRETATSVAEALHSRAVPFVFVTGYADLASIPEPLRNAPLVRKPVSLGTLCAVLDTLAL